MDIYENRIKPLFVKSGKSDWILEKEIKLPRGIIYDWNSRRSKSYKKYVGEIAAYFGVSTDYLLGNTDIKNKPVANDDDELQEYLEYLKNREDGRILFSLAKNATKEDVMRAVAIIEALKKEEERQE